MNFFAANDGRLRSVWRFVLAVFVTYIANVMAAGLAASAGRGRLFEMVYRTLALVFVLAGYSFLLVIADRVEENPLAAMGLALRKPWLRDAAMGLAIGAALVALAAACIALFGHLSFNLSHSHQLVKPLIVVLATLVFGAMLEEVMFRGYPFQRLVESTGPLGGVLILSALFGAAHLANPAASLLGFLNTVAVGVLFCLAYLRTRSLWMPWGIHFGWNFTLGVIFGLPVSGITGFAVLVRSKAEGSQWLTGGNYGIEASVPGTVVILLGIFLLAAFVKPRRPSAALNECGSFEGQDGNSAERIQL